MDNAMTRQRRYAPLGRIEPETVGPSLALLAMIVIFSLLSPYFLTRSNITNVLVQCAPLLILAAGQTFPVLMGGLIFPGLDRQPRERRDGRRYDGSHRAGRRRRTWSVASALAC